MNGAAGPRHAVAIDRVRRAAIQARGVTDPALRRAVYDATAQPPPLGPYLDKVRERAWTISDEDIGALQASGYSEDAILELTIAAAAPPGAGTTSPSGPCVEPGEVRLSVLERGHRLRARLFFAVASRLAGGEQVDDVFKTILYRPALVGGPAFTRMIRGALRGPSEWSVGERELFAAATSQANACSFCADIHSRTATLTLGSEVTPQIVADAEEAEFRPQAKAMIRLIEKVSQDPGLVTTQDVDAVRAAGVSEAAIEDGLAICFAFNLINRLADAFEYDWDSERHRSQGARALVRFGYRVPRFLLR